MEWVHLDFNGRMIIIDSAGEILASLDNAGVFPWSYMFLLNVDGSEQRVIATRTGKIYRFEGTTLERTHDLGETSAPGEASWEYGAPGIFADLDGDGVVEFATGNRIVDLDGVDRTPANMAAWLKPT